MAEQWLVHPNRSETGPNKAGRNGHYRAARGSGRRLPQESCLARVVLPSSLADVADEDGSVTFAGESWSFVTGAARSFVRRHINEDTLAPFGFKRGGQWVYWDGTVAAESRHDGSGAATLVENYLRALFPRGTHFELAEQSPTAPATRRAASQERRA